MTSSQQIKNVFFFTIAFLSFAACDPGPQFANALQSQSIYGGSADQNPHHIATVALTMGTGPNMFCSGALISPDIVLTAAHCLVNRQPNSLIGVFFGDDLMGEGQFALVKEGLSHPDYRRETMNADIGLLRLRRVVSADLVPVPFLPASLALTEADRGSEIDFSGFGDTENGTNGKKLHVIGTIGRVCDATDGCDLDGHYVNDRAFAYLMNPGGPCYGDSGGPAYFLRDGHEYVAGVISYGDDCTSYGVNTSCAAFADWIETFMQSGHSEDCANSVDDDGDAAVDCDDDDCATYPACLGENACKQAQSISCGETLSGQTGGGAYHFSTYSCAPEFHCLGPERAFSLIVPAGVDAEFTLQQGDGGNLDLFLLGASSGDCDTQDCRGHVLGLDNPKRLSFSMPNEALMLIVETGFSGPNSFDLTLNCDGEVENCVNVQDDDGDGKIDCDDEDCHLHQACLPELEICDNNVDDDGDGFVDCDDEDCLDFSSCAAVIEDCSNAIDDDADGQIDCQDSDCSGATVCLQQDDKAKAELGRGCACSAQAALSAVDEYALFLLLLLGFAWRHYRKTACWQKGTNARSQP